MVFLAFSRAYNQAASRLQVFEIVVHICAGRIAWSRENSAVISMDGTTLRRAFRAPPENFFGIGIVPIGVDPERQK
jgi:hypothetical protein